MARTYMPFVYFIKSKKFNWVYIGSTNNLGKRLENHNAGAVRSTKSKRPFALVYSEEFTTIGEARKREKSLKGNRSLKQDILRNLGIIT